MNFYWLDTTKTGSLVVKQPPAAYAQYSMGLKFWDIILIIMIISMIALIFKTPNTKTE